MQAAVFAFPPGPVRGLHNPDIVSLQAFLHLWPGRVEPGAILHQIPHAGHR
jgi:hypothetical protein